MEGVIPEDVRTPLIEGVQRTLEQFRRLRAEGRLDTSDLEG